ncbi:MAG TPA: transposase [Pseudobdellovibrionaceae bacterium]
MADVWDIFSNYIFFIQKAYNLEIHSFILMSNHFHMLLKTPEANLDRAMNYFLREVSKEIGRKSERTNQIFGGPYHRSLLKSEIYYYNAYKYVYQNPVRAGLCQQVEDYPYSTIRNLLGKQKSIIPISGDNIIGENPFTALKWLNQRLDDSTLDCIRRGLRKYEFKVQQDKNSGKLPNLDVPTLD